MQSTILNTISELSEVAEFNTEIANPEQLLEIEALLLENNKRIEKAITKLNNEVLKKISVLLGHEAKPKTTRTRTITPVSEDDRCSASLLSGANKGNQCSKKSVIGTLCTMHNKKALALLPSPPSSETSSF
jgi:hypothetical protein